MLSPTKQSEDPSALEAWDLEHIIHPELAAADKLEPVVMVQGKGVYVTNVRGHRNLDATGNGQLGSWSRRR